MGMGDLLQGGDIMDEELLKWSFEGHTVGKDKFTRRMAILMADFFCVTPKDIVVKLESMKLLKPGSWEWFVENGGITKDQIKQIREEVGRVQ